MQMPTSSESPIPHVPTALRLELLALLSMDPGQETTMTYREFLEWATEDTLAEWVNGRVVMTSPASARHQKLAAFLYDVLSAHVDTHNLGTVFIAPFQMKLPHSGREPDVLFLAKEHLARLRATYLEGPADLTIEVVSPESKGRDRGDKFYEYQEAGVPEYWLIDPATEHAEFYQLDAAGTYQLVPPGEDGIYRSRILPDLWLRVAWLWQDPLLSLTRTMLAIDGDAYARRLLADLRDEGYAP